MNIWSILGLIFQYGPALFSAIAALIAAIRAKNVVQGKDAINKTTQLAADIVTSLQTRADLTNDQKREQAVSDLIVGATSLGINITESQARTLVELNVQQIKNAIAP